MQVSLTLSILLSQAVSIYGQTFPAYCSENSTFDFSSYLNSTPGNYTATVAVSDISDTPVGNVTFGTKTLPITFDTGSATDWVLGAAAVASPGSKPLSLTYSPPAGQAPLPGYFCAAYSYAMATGPLYPANFTFGGVTFPASTLGIANLTTAQFSRTMAPSSGLLGLGLAGNERYMPPQPNWLIRNIRNFKAKVMASALRKGGTGTFDFGFIDDTKHTGTIQYTTTLVDTTADYWTFMSSNVRLSSGVIIPVPRLTIVDSGSPTLALSREAAAAYYAPVPGVIPLGSPPSLYSVPCSASLPSISVEYGLGRYLTIPGSRLLTAPDTPTSPYCLGKITATNGSQLLGFPLYQTYYIVHNLINQTLGFAPQSFV